ncbi:UDP-N-acetylglucosamine diphosphorylase/glucosamine-1-phosphate N-acetyltransferase [Moheibacter sediminis]|uniref:UDP-N-acetylglucosamine diphosphorylase/glucosamine-1-phosphate N-acetyltransferase n=2 Tax=Moheibacter sediminis TaxID=1434700 RepID=A0A1W1Z2P8_9FLAO|nr:UDP-N-acetylglucosamine diphosphorylase/glucosamine-1-phosphate N-acetyltransferase [Moheibacter sediminis]
METTYLMNIVLFDDKEWENLRPLTLNKPVSELRMGILTFKERWEKLIEGNYSYFTQDYLSEKFELNVSDENLFINPSFFPNENLLSSIRDLKKSESIWFENQMIAGNFSLEEFEARNQSNQKIDLKEEVTYINHLWDLFTYNDKAIQFDFELITKGRKSQPVSSTNGVINPENIFLEEGAVVEFAVLNAKEGPIYVGKNAEIMEGSLVRGSLALCENAKLNLGAKIYPGTTIGPYCKVGGEVNNSILMGYSNKGHDGFLGNSILGEWCNLGADTNNSNLKNNYSEIKVWDYESKDYIDTRLQFCGLMMGDYAKSAINTQFNTGTVVGISANVFDAGFPPKFIPSFSWGGGKNSAKFDLEKSYEAAEKMMERRKKILTEKDKRIIEYIFQLTEY